MKKTFKDAELQAICLGSAIITTSTSDVGAVEENVPGGGNNLDDTN